MYIYIYMYICIYVYIFMYVHMCVKTYKESAGASSQMRDIPRGRIDMEEDASEIFLPGDPHSVLQCVAVRCSVLQSFAICCSVLQCVAVCRSVSQYVV